jgi:hypothetical protein
VNDNPDPESFIAADDTTLMDGSAFERPLDMNESSPPSVNGNDQQQQFDDITSHGSSTSTPSEDDGFDLDAPAVDAPVGSDSQLQEFLSFDAAQSLDSVSSLEQEPPLAYPMFEQSQTLNYGPSFVPQPPLYAPPPFDVQPPLPQLPYQLQRSGPASPFHGPAMRGDMLHPPNLRHWTDNIYTPGHGHRSLDYDNIYTNEPDSTHLYPTTSLPELDLRAPRTTAGPTPTPSMGILGGSMLGSTTPSFAGISSDLTAFNSQPSAIGEHIADSTFIQCNQCAAKFDGKKKKQDMLRHYDTVHDIRDGKAYRCLECPRGCWYPKDLVKHMTVHSGKKNYRCTICLDEAFTRSDNLGRHMAMFH